MGKKKEQQPASAKIVKEVKSLVEQSLTPASRTNKTEDIPKSANSKAKGKVQIQETPKEKDIVQSVNTKDKTNGDPAKKYTDGHPSVIDTTRDEQLPPNFGRRDINTPKRPINANISNIEQHGLTKKDVVVFNENWKKLKPNDFKYMQTHFEQLTAWKRRKHIFRESIIRNLFSAEATQHYSLRGFYHLFIIGLCFFFGTHPMV